MILIAQQEQIGLGHLKDQVFAGHLGYRQAVLNSDHPMNFSGKI
jgi:hypothetical protein